MRGSAPGETTRPQGLRSLLFCLLLVAGSAHASTADDAVAVPGTTADSAPRAAPAGSISSTVTLSSLEWPPYTGATLPDGGRTTQQLRQLLARAGYRLEVKFAPWTRTVAMAESDPAVAGYFPEYLTPGIAAKFSCSAPIGHSPLGFAWHARRPFDWQSLTDLRPLRVGIVSGYVNSVAFDAEVESGRIRTETVGTDLQNLRMLIQGRVDVIVIDREVMRWLLEHERSLAVHARQLHFHPRLLAEHALHACFRRDAQGMRVRDALLDVQEHLHRQQAAEKPGAD